MILLESWGIAWFIIICACYVYATLSFRRITWSSQWKKVKALSWLQPLPAVAALHEVQQEQGSVTYKERMFWRSINWGINKKILHERKGYCNDLAFEWVTIFMWITLYACASMWRNWLTFITWLWPLSVWKVLSVLPEAILPNNKIH